MYEKDTEFAKHKKALELLASMYPNTLGLRIFPVFGESDHGTFIMQAIRSMKKGESPIVYGDGTQGRDFINIQEVIHQIMRSLDNTGIIDIGGGTLTEFNDIVDMINEHLGTDIKPKYINAPKDYSEGIKANNPYPVGHSISQHIKFLCQ